MDLVRPLWRYTDERIAGWCHCFVIFRAGKCSRIHRALIARSLFSFFVFFVALYCWCRVLRQYSGTCSLCHALHKRIIIMNFCVCVCESIRSSGFFVTYSSRYSLRFLCFCFWLSSHLFGDPRRWRRNDCDGGYHYDKVKDKWHTYTQSTLTHIWRYIPSSAQTNKNFRFDGEREDKAPIDLILLSFAILAIQSSRERCANGKCADIFHSNKARNFIRSL